MASAVSRPTGEQGATIFSYAQAAKGRTASVAPTSTTQSSQAASGTNTPLRDAASSANPSLNASQVAGESESSKVSQQADVAGNIGAKAINSESESSGSKSGRANASSSPSSPSFGTASTATLPKEEEIPSTQNGPTEHGGWERRPQNSSSTVNTGDRYIEAPEGRRGKGKRSANNRNNKDSEKKEVEKEKEPVKQPEAPLVAAPVPVVNVWTARKEAATKAKPATQTPTKVDTPSVNGVGSAAKPSEQKRRGKTDDNDKTGQTAAAKEATKSQKKTGDVRREEPTAKRAAPRGSRTGEKDEKPAPTQLPPSVEDAASWPTPDTVAEGEKRKTQDKTVKEDETEDSMNKEKRPKETWTKIPFTPTAVFNTPIPTRGRGNRGGARGGRDAGGRGGHMSNGNSSGDKSAVPALPNAASNEGKEQRGRDNASAGRAASLPPQTLKRASSDDPHAGRDQREQSNAHEKARPNAPQSAKVEQTPFDLESRRPSVVPANGAVLEFHPGAEFHQTPGQSRADFSQSDRFNQTNTEFGQPGKDRRSESNTRSVDGFAGGVGYTQQRGDSRAERGRYRGRGGQNSFANGQVHMPAGAFQNGHTMQMQNAFPVRQGPYSPPLNQAQYAPAYGAPPRGRGGRGQSVSGNNMYGRYSGVNGHHMSPIQTAGPMFGYQGLDPMSAPPFNPYVEQFNMVTLVRAQLEYYFSVDNLCKDVYLRKHMDSQGFVYLTFIANFSRMQKLTPDLELIRFAAEGSESIELAQGNDGIDRLRARHGWEQWVLPMDQRDASAKNAGPAQLIRPQIQRHSFDAQMQMHPGISTFSPNGMEPAFQPFPMPQAAMPIMNGHVNGGTHQHESPLSAAVSNFTPSMPLPTEETNSLEAETTFKDEEIDGLTVVIGAPNRDDKSSFASSRTFSDGSINNDFQDQESHKGRSGTNGASDNSSPTSTRRSRSPFTSLSAAERNTAPGNGPTILWFKGRNQAAPVTSEVPHRTDTSYTTFRATALRHRDASHLGQTDHNMKVLYEFWSHFLVRNFNPGMYTEFHGLALEDAYQRQTTVGVSHLITYYDEMLNSKKKPMPEKLAEHYVHLVNQEKTNEERPGFVKLRAAWRNGAIDMKSRKRIDNFVDAQLREELER